MTRTVKYSLGGLVALLFVSLVSPAQAAQAGKALNSGKERLVLMPLRVAEEDKSLQGAMETALVQGLQQKYEVFSGEQVAQKARAIFNKESRSTNKKECDETRCMQGIAEAFQAELIATANVIKRDGGYFLALSVQNIFDNKVVYSNSLPCKNCDSFQVVDKLKELVSPPSTIGAAPTIEAPQPKVNLNDPDGALWMEAQKGNAVEDYQVYLDSYPKGKYVPLAKARIKKIKEAGRAAIEQQEQQAWDTAQQENSEASYGLYLKDYPKGRFVGLAKVRSNKLKNDVAARVFKDCAECPEMVIVPAGSFDMGSNDGDVGEQPVHRVAISQPFAMGKTHITRGQFAVFVNATGYDAGNKCKVFEKGWEEKSGYNWRKPGYPQEDSHPVACINWNDAKAYAEWLANKTGKQYRLPSEAEWEYAARAGTTGADYWGESPDQACGYANVMDQTLNNQLAGALSEIVHNCTDGYAYTAPVGRFKPNAFGLYDMQGNLWQWVSDSFHGRYYTAPADGTEWLGDGTMRVFRGGSWDSPRNYVNSAFRNSAGPGNRIGDLGFRVARTLP